MNIIRKSLALLGSVALLALLLAALMPRAARGVAAALVQVTNTSANPVPTSATSSLVPFFGHSCIEVVTTSCQVDNGAGEFVLTPTTAPNGSPVKWVVIDQVAGNCISLTANQITPGFILGVPAANDGGKDDAHFFRFPITPAVVSNFPTAGVFVFDTHIYVLPGNDLDTFISVLPANADGMCRLYFQGHLEI